MGLQLCISCPAMQFKQMLNFLMFAMRIGEINFALIKRILKSLMVSTVLTISCNGIICCSCTIALFFHIVIERIMNMLSCPFNFSY